MKRGRPPKPADERSRCTSVWLTPLRIARLKLLGGSRWVARMIDQQPQPKEPSK